MVAGNIVLIGMGWLFLIFETFFHQKSKAFRYSITRNAGLGNDPRDRVFNIKSQAERYDGQGKFRKLWLQETLF